MMVRQALVLKAMWLLHNSEAGHFMNDEGFDTELFNWRFQMFTV